MSLLTLPFIQAAQRSAAGDLAGTLTPEGGLSQLEAAQAEIAQQLAARTTAAQQAAGQAGTAFQEAAGAPPPGFLPGDTFLPQILGAIASVIGQSPEFSRQAEEGIATRRSALLKARAENLQALRDQFLEKAREAQQAGDREAEITARQKFETLSKQFDLVNSNAERAAAMERTEIQEAGALEREQLRGRQAFAEIRARGEQERITQKEKPKFSASERAAATRQGLDPDSGLLLSTVANREVTRRLALAKKGDSKSRSEALQGALELAGQRWHTDKTLRDMAGRLARLQHPFYGVAPKDARYALTEERIYQKIRGKWVKDAGAAERAAAAAVERALPWFQQAPTVGAR